MYITFASGKTLIRPLLVFVVISHRNIMKVVKWSMKWPNYDSPQRSWSKVIFSVACVRNSVHRGDLPHGMLGYILPKTRGRPPMSRHPPRGRHPPRADTLQEQTPPRSRHTPPGADPRRSRHPLHSTCWEIWPTSRHYASYWIAYLFRFKTIG